MEMNLSTMITIVRIRTDMCQNRSLFHMGEAQFLPVQDFHTMINHMISNTVTIKRTIDIIFATLLTLDYLEFQ